MYTILGIQNVDFKAADGNHIKGTRLYVSYPKNHVKGVACESIFIKESIDCGYLSVGDVIDFTYNKFGKVESIKF